MNQNSAIPNFFNPQKAINKQNIDARLQRIANVLLLNASFIDNIGLLNGKMGIAIFFYRYGHYSNNNVYTDYAGELIDEIYEEISINTPISFEDGLIGIGWGIEYLIKSKFLEANTNEALSEVDSAIYHYKLQNPNFLDYDNVLFSYGIYYSALTIGLENENFKFLPKKHYLLLLIKECEQFLIYKVSLDFNISTLNIGAINSFLWFFLRLYELGLYPFKVSKLLKYLPDYIDFNKLENIKSAEYFVLNNLIQKAIELVSNIEIQKKYQIIAGRIDTDFDSTIDDLFLVNYVNLLNLYELVYAPYINGDYLKHSLFERAFKIIDNEEAWNHRLDKINKSNLGLIGLAGLGLTLLKDIT